MNANDAQQVFATTEKAQPANRTARFGHAVSLLAVQPRTPSNTAQATQIFEALRSENANDDAGIGAMFYLARIRQLHSFTPDRQAAVSAYRALLTAHPEHYYAQLAVPKLALLLLYDDVPPTEWEHRVSEIAALIPRLSLPAAQRDTRLVLADAFIKLHRDHARAYPLITACLEANLITRVPHLNTLLLQAGESARMLGKDAETIAHYRRFLEEFPRDSRADEIRRRIAALPRRFAQ